MLIDTLKNLTQSQLDSVVALYGGEKNVKKILDEEAKRLALRARQKKEDEATLAAAQRDITTWKTITVGVYKTPGQYRMALIESGHRFRDKEDGDYLDRIPLAQAISEIDLVAPSIYLLGLYRGATYHEICEAGVRMGFELCLDEIGPALRLSYMDQPDSDMLRIAKKISQDSDQYYVVSNFTGQTRLHCERGSFIQYWDSKARFVFIRPRQA